MKPYYEHGGITIYNADCRALLCDLRVDLLLTDPPYGLGLTYLRRDGYGARGGVSERLQGDSDTVLSEWVWSVAPGSVAVVFADERTWRTNLLAAEAANWSVRTVVWDKVKPSMQISLRRQFELILVGTKEGHAYADDRSFTDVQRCLRSEGTGHPTAKPVDLLQRVLGFCEPRLERCIVDPFMGSGSTLVAAKNLGRRAIGIEIEERYCEIAAKRLSQEVLAIA